MMASTTPSFRHRPAALASLCALAAVSAGIAFRPMNASAAVAPPAPGPTGDWNFQATLDGKPIGEHRFTVTGQGNERAVHSAANFDVKFFGVTVYTYVHDARERWRDGCLVSLDARTDDDRKASSIQARKEGDAADAPLKVTGAPEPEALPGCVMTFAYWNPAMRGQARLLNPQTGRYEAVKISEAEGGTVEVRGKQVEARKLRLTGPKDAIDLWYSPQGEWLALDSTVGKRSLSYRLK